MHNRSNFNPNRRGDGEEKKGGGGKTTIVLNVIKLH